MCTLIQYLIAIFYIVICAGQLLADVHIADDCAVNTIQTIHDDVGVINGDIISIPACAETTWATTLTITKHITLQGAGKTATFIKHDVDAEAIHLHPTAEVEAPNVIRITGMSFNKVSSSASRHAILIVGPTNNSFALTRVRIDNNAFVRGSRAVFLTGYTYGLIDANVFTNCDIAVAPQGDYDYAWTRWGTDQSAGTATATFIENNLFILTETAGMDEQIYHQSGAKSVVRFNTFDATETNDIAFFYDSHGNWGGVDRLDYRGQPLIEVYNNKIDLYSGTQGLYIRGGSAIVFRNAMTTTTAFTANRFILLTDEESWTSGGPFGAPPAPATEWPTEDQINNSFFWDNTVNGTGVTGITLNSADTDVLFIELSRDYFLAAPGASGGSESYTTRTNNMTFSAEGANAYYPYTPYTCPHPLVGTGSCDSATAGTAGYHLGTKHQFPTGTMSFPAAGGKWQY